LLCWKGGWTLAPKDESFFNVIGKNHQVEEKEEEEEEEEEEAVEEEGEGEEGRRRSRNATTNATDNNDEENPYVIDVASYRISLGTDAAAASKGSERR